MTESEATALVLVMFLLFATVAVGGILALGFYVVFSSARQSRRLEEISDLRDVMAEMRELRADLRGEMQGLRADVKNEVRGLRPGGG